MGNKNIKKAEKKKKKVVDKKNTMSSEYKPTYTEVEDVKKPE